MPNAISILHITKRLYFRPPNSAIRTGPGRRVVRCITLDFLFRFSNYEQYRIFCPLTQFYFLTERLGKDR
jgi:hypothetical protein